MTADRTSGGDADASDELQVLHVDDPEAVAALSEYAGRECDHVAVTGAATTDAALDALRDETPDCLVFDSERPHVRVEVEADDEAVALRVVDDGPGIPDTEREVIERATETPLQHSSGLGLWLVNWIVDHSDGDLSFERAGDETVVAIRLDRA